jgi:hypothetical protein
MKVTVKAPFSIQVLPASVLPYGVQPNTIFLGYGPQSLALKAVPLNSPASPLTYHWSNGLSNQVLNVVPAGAGVYTYSVLAEDSAGCTSNPVTTHVQVIDIRCGNKNDKVIICQRPPGNVSNAHTICVSPSAVAAHLAQGAYLGNCAGARSLATVDVMPVATIKAYPNPNSGRFELQLQHFTPGNLQVTVYDQIGKLVFTGSYKTTEQAENITIGLEKMPAGVYNLRVTGSDNQHLSTRVVITR